MLNNFNIFKISHIENNLEQTEEIYKIKFQVKELQTRQIQQIKCNDMSNRDQN